MGIFGINTGSAQKMHSSNQHSFVAMQHLVMSMEDYQNNIGKKSFFGKDKGTEAALNFQNQLACSLVAMCRDGLISKSTSDEDVSRVLKVVLYQFQEAFPGWVSAYKFAEYFFNNVPVPSVIRDIRSAIDIQALATAADLRKDK